MVTCLALLTTRREVFSDIIYHIYPRLQGPPSAVCFTLAACPPPPLPVLTRTISFSRSMRSTEGMNPAPMPWILCGPGLPPDSTGDSVGSTATTCTEGMPGRAGFSARQRRGLSRLHCHHLHKKGGWGEGTGIATRQHRGHGRLHCHHLHRRNGGRLGFLPDSTGDSVGSTATTCTGGG